MFSTKASAMWSLRSFCQSRALSTPIVELSALKRALSPDSLPQPQLKGKIASVAIVGAPNAGKSTLMNRLIGTRIAAVSRKVNTTRRRIMGSCTEGDRQLIFWDTPGIVERRFLQTLGSDRREVAVTGWGTAEDSDIVVMLVDASRRPSHVQVAAHLTEQLADVRRRRNESQTLFLAFNKCDVVRPRTKLLELADYFQQNVPSFDTSVSERIFMISAYNGKGVAELKDALLDRTVPGEFWCMPGEATDEDDADIVEQHIWEKMLNRLHQEVPYNCQLQLEDWRETPNGNILAFFAIRVPKPRHVSIVVGPQGKTIQWIKETASESCSTALKRKVSIRIRVVAGKQAL